MSIGNSSNSLKRIRAEDLNVSSTERPNWVPGSARTPKVGEEIYCAGGAGVVTAVLGKTGDGSRLIQIQLADPTAKPFFAAASNVLLAPE